MQKSITFSIICSLLFILSIARAQTPSGKVMNDSIQQLNTVIVTKKKQLIERKNDKIILNISNSSLATGNSALEILSRAPGVTVSNEGNISLRGKSGVSVMINGKINYLSSDQLVTLLRNTNGNSIESIELINNPSAKYDATGSGGIINIKLKKNQNYGTNITLLLEGGYGNYYKSNGGINFNHRNQKVNVFGSYDYTNNKDFEDLNLNRSNVFDSEITYFNQFGRDIYNRENKSYKIGIDYELDAKNSIGLTFNGYDNKARSTTKNTTSIGHFPLLTDSSIIAINTGNSKYSNQTYNLNYKSIIDTSGQELTADLDFATFTNINRSNYANNFYDNKGLNFKPTYVFRNAAPSNIKIWSGKIDYTYPFSDQTKLETGIKSSYVITNNDFIQEELKNNNWINDVANSNSFNYKEVVNAIYTNIQHKFKRLTLQIGLRAELTHSVGYSPVAQSKVKRNYLDLFPNINLSKIVNEDHEFGLSYSKRIDRPDYESLNPFIYFADLYTYSQGNPYLNPQYTNAYDFIYNYQKKWSASLGYSCTKDVITTTLINNPLKKTLFIMEQNLASQQNYNLNIGAPLSFTKWWETSNDVTLYYTKFESPNLMGMPFNSEKLTYLLNTIQTFTINKSFGAQVVADYQSAQVYGTYAVKPLYGVDFGMSKSFADKKAMIKLAINDVFNLRSARINSAIPLQDYRLYQKQESRIFRLSFSYNFGSRSIKVVRAHSKSSNTEQSRVKSGN